MLYQHSLEIQERLETVLVLIETGKYSTPSLARQVGVSVPTVSRMVAALRARGHEIRARKNGNGWRYVLVRKAAARSQQTSVSGKNASMATRNDSDD